MLNLGRHPLRTSGPFSFAPYYIVCALASVSVKTEVLFVLRGPERAKQHPAALQE